MDDATWLALTVTLTLVGAVATWVAYRRRGLPAAMLAAGVTVLVPAAYLTRTLRMLTEVADAVAGWATSLVLSPTVWAGIVLAGLGVLLIAGSRALAARGIGARRRGVPRGATDPSGCRRCIPARRSRIASFTVNAVSAMPSGSKTRSRMTSPRRRPVIPSTTCPSQSMLLPYSQRSPGSNSSGVMSDRRVAVAVPI